MTTRSRPPEPAPPPRPRRPRRGPTDHQIHCDSSDPHRRPTASTCIWSTRTAHANSCTGRGTSASPRCREISRCSSTPPGVPSGKWTQLVVRDDGEPEEMFDPPPRGLYCPGRLAWPRRAPGRVAMICETRRKLADFHPASDADRHPTSTETPDPSCRTPSGPADRRTPGAADTDAAHGDGAHRRPRPPSRRPPRRRPPGRPGAVDSNPAIRVARAAFVAGGIAAERSVAPPTQAVYLAKVDKDGHVDGGSMTEVAGFPDQGLERHQLHRHRGPGGQPRRRVRPRHLLPSARQLLAAHPSHVRSRQ